jgi:putative sigma-54 modulation protein
MIEVTIDLKDRGDGRPHADRKTEEDKCRVEFVVQAEHKHDFVAHESHHDVVAATDLALGKIQAQLRRYKGKIQDHRRTPSTGEVAGSAPREDGDE